MFTRAGDESQEGHDPVRILVCFKVTPDFEVLREPEWIAGEGDLADGAGVVTRFAPRVLNCFDESALELALRLRDGCDGGDPPVELQTLTVGGREADPYLKTLLALGYERAARLDVAQHFESGPDIDFAPDLIADAIVAYTELVARPDLLLLGCRSGPGDGGTVPFRVAEALGWPCLADVVELEPAGRDSLRVVCRTDAGLLGLTAKMPLVLAVGNAVVSRLRVPTLADRLARRYQVLDVLSAGDLGLDASAGMGSGKEDRPRLVSLRAVRRGRAGTVVHGPTPGAKAQALYDDYLKSVLERL